MTKYQAKRKADSIWGLAGRLYNLLATNQAEELKAREEIKAAHDAVCEAALAIEKEWGL